MCNEGEVFSNRGLLKESLKGKRLASRTLSFRTVGGEVEVCQESSGD